MARKFVKHPSNVSASYDPTLDDDEYVQGGLFGKKKKQEEPKDPKAAMEEYLNKVNQVGNQFDKLQEQALSKYGRKVNSADSMNNIATNGDALQNRIHDKVLEVMQTPEFGFDANEAYQYCRVTLEDVENSTRIEVGVEVSYEGMCTIVDELNPIVKEVDPDAYFDFDEPGIISAYIDNRYLE